jgi:acetate kinase
MSTVLVINPGCTSKKYGIFRDGTALLEASYEKTETGFQSVRCAAGTPTKQQVESEDNYRHALSLFANEVKDLLAREQTALTAIGVRVVASGSSFQKHEPIDDLYISRLRAQEKNAPLHIPTVLHELQQCRLLFDGIPLIAVSDTAFFAGLPALAREYSLPRGIVEQHDIHRFGYHGLSVTSVVNRIHSIIGADPERLIVCHVGNGCSVTGVRNGQPVFTSAGFSTLSSLPMLSRSGDLDASALLHLARVYGDDDALRQLLHHESGVRGMTGTEDLRQVFEMKSHGNETASFVLDLLATKLQESIAAATVATAGIDAIVITGTIGFRSPTFRELMTTRLAHFGIGLDEDKNDGFHSREGVISLRRSLTKVVVMRTEEMREIARCALEQAERMNRSSASI